ncbi:hypothetical protein L9F63_026415, partial [Diploptera punctata]
LNRYAIFLRYSKIELLNSPVILPIGPCGPAVTTLAFVSNSFGPGSPWGYTNYFSFLLLDNIPIVKLIILTLLKRGPLQYLLALPANISKCRMVNAAVASGDGWLHQCCRLLSSPSLHNNASSRYYAQHR